MAKVAARATKQVGAAPERVLEFLRDYRESRRHGHWPLERLDDKHALRFPHV